jgi:predicted DNA-binding transcriptional regulator YafY
MPAPEARKLVDAPYFSLRHPTGAPKYAGPIRDAIRKQRIVQLTYANGAGQSSQRRAQPLAIWNYAEGWMFSAWCDLRQSFRTFRFDRIQHLAITDDPFDTDAAKGLRAFMDHDPCETHAP